MVWDGQHLPQKSLDVLWVGTTGSQWVVWIRPPEEQKGNEGFSWVA